MIVEVDQYSYRELMDLPPVDIRGGDYIHHYQEMEVTPDELKWLIDNCVDIRMINNEEQ